MVWDSGARPVVLLNKVDLCPDACDLRRRNGGYCTGNSRALAERTRKTGLETVQGYLACGNTGRFVGRPAWASHHHHGLANTGLRVQPVLDEMTADSTPPVSRKMLFLPREAL